jgi:hypothetical protein
MWWRLITQAVCLQAKRGIRAAAPDRRSFFADEDRVLIAGARARRRTLLRTMNRRRGQVPANTPQINRSVQECA